MRKVFELKSGTITLGSTKRKRAARHGGGAQTLDEVNDDTITLSFMPRLCTKRRMLTVTVSRQAFAKGSFSGIAHISANNIIPNDSRVFDVVRSGNLLGLQKMLREGTASLRDHDECGQSLLCVSTSPSTAQLLFP